MSARLGAFAGNHVVFAEQVKKAGFLEFESAIGLAALVDQQGKLDSCLFAEGFCILHISESYSRQVCSLAPECLFMLAQLRNVLAAEDSTVMAQENQHHW